MPELPEIEITRLGIAPFVEGRKITGVTIRERRLRWPVARGLEKRLIGCELRQIVRRGKYLLFDCGAGWLIVHLGMSGSLRIVPRRAAIRPHEHLDIVFGETTLRLRDPRRFGAVLWTARHPDRHRLIAGLGVEPLSEAFTDDYLFGATRRRKASVKQLLMNNAIVVGVGNIYASESLFRAAIAPRMSAGRLRRDQCARLVRAIRETLHAALAAGGSSLQDFVHSDGSRGWFQQQHFVYGRAGLPCRVCGTTIASERLGQRSSFYCPACQRLSPR